MNLITNKANIHKISVDHATKEVFIDKTIWTNASETERDFIRLWVEGLEFARGNESLNQDKRVRIADAYALSKHIEKHKSTQLPFMFMMRTLLA